MTRGRFALVSVSAVSFSLLWSLLCNGAIELFQAGGDVHELLATTLDERLFVFLLGSSVVWCVFLLVWAASGRLTVATGILTAASVLLGYANHKKLSLRLEPLYPSDFGFVGDPTFLEQMVGIGTALALVLMVTVVGLAIWFVSRSLRRTYPRLERRMYPRRWAAVTAVRVLVLAVAIGTLTYATGFNDSGNKLRGAYETAGASWAFWFQQLNYERNGFVGGMLYNLDVDAMPEPPGYSRPTMAELARRYSRDAARLNASRRSDALDDVNIVSVLSEAFSDPRSLDGVDYAEDPIPYTRELMTHTPSGEMLAQLFGGGTANMEFETFTGMSLSQFSPQMQTPYQMLVPDYDSFPSAVGLAKAQGRKPIAVHPYMTSMYKRETVYPILGFEDFVSRDDMPEAKKMEDSDFISDASAFSEVTDRIQDEDQPLLVNLVTMQNHYPMKDEYAEPLTITGLVGEPREEAEGYGRGLRYSDEALRDFIGDLEKSPEKTAVVFYGDHLPAFWPEQVRKRNGPLTMKKTPFFLWANFPIKQESLPTTSPIYFLPLLYDAIGAPLPPYYALLLELHDAIPAMEQGVYLDSQGLRRTAAELSPHARRLLRDYRLVQYDLSVGGRYSQDEMFYPEVAPASAASQ